MKNFKAKISYFWDYYKWCVIIPVLVLYVVISLTITFVNEHKDAAIYVVFTNCSDVFEAEEEIRTTYVEMRGIDTRKNPVQISDGIFYPAGMNENSYVDQGTGASIQKYTMMITNQKADVTFTTSWVAQAYELNDCYADLRDYFDEEFLSEYSDKIFYAQNSQNESVPIGIYADNWSKLGIFYEQEKPIMVMDKNSTNPEEMVTFVKWVLNQKEDT